MLCCYYVGNEFMENIEDPLAPAKNLCSYLPLLWSPCLWGFGELIVVTAQSGNLG